MVDSNWTGKDHSSRGNCYSDWTVQKGRAQSHCHELHPSDAKNHFVLYYLVLLGRADHWGIEGISKRESDNVSVL